MGPGDLAHLLADLGSDERTDSGRSREQRRRGGGAVDDRRALVQTGDLIPPVLDDPLNGLTVKIAGAKQAFRDIFAMGARY